MKLSVIIPCFNAAKTISEQLEALSKQQWNHTWEVVVVNNCSTDNTMEIVDSFQNEITNLVTVDACKRKNVSYARNKGVEESHGEYIAFCDADDVVGDKWVASIGNALCRHNFVACRMDWTRLNDFSEHTLKAKVQTEGLSNFFMDGFFPHAGGGSLGIRKKIHFQVGGFDEDIPYLEDTDYCWKVQRKGYPLTFITEAIVHIRARKTHFDILRQEMKWSEYDLYLYERYKPHGMPDFSIKKPLKSLYYLLRASKQLFSPRKRTLWIIRLGIELGRIKGIGKYKLFKHGLIKQELQKVVGSV